MHDISKKTLSEAYKPFDVVSNVSGDVGFISEVNVNRCQPEPQHQISYSITWLTGTLDKVAWFDGKELVFHCNLFVKIAEKTCHPFGNNEGRVKELLNSGLK